MSAKLEVARDVLAADVLDWLAARRHADPGTGLRQSGISSNALAMHALGMPLDPRTEGPYGYPLDAGDLAACYLTVMRAPERLRPRMWPVLAKWRVRVALHHDLTEMDRELGLSS